MRVRENAKVERVVPNTLSLESTRAKRGMINENALGQRVPPERGIMNENR